MEPKYKQILKTVKKQIIDGKYPAGSMIPDQNTLARDFKTSRMTVKKALDMLAIEGFIYSKRGAGTFVKKNALAQKDALPVDNYGGLSSQFSKARVKSEPIVFDVTFPTPEIKERLELKQNEPVYEILRLRFVDDEPYALEHTFMPISLIPNLSQEVLFDSIYAYLTKEIHLEIGGAFRKISAEKASKNDLKYLASAETDPILQVEQVVYLQDGRPFEYSISRHPYNGKHAYTIFDRKN